MSGALILASGSPQRRAILEQLGIPFEVIVSGAEELEAGPPQEVVLENAFRKADAVARGLAAGTLGDPGCAGDPDRSGPAMILGCDTVVVLRGTVYGKPRDADHALETLRLLNGHSHRVMSGICVIDGEPDALRTRTAAAVTTVTFRRLDEETLSWYVATGEWQDRAGGYAIQGRGAALVAGIEGDYLNVVGLPVPTLLDLAPNLLQ